MQDFFEQTPFFGRPGDIEKRFEFLASQNELLFIQLPIQVLLPDLPQQGVLAELLESTPFDLPDAPLRQVQEQGDLLLSQRTRWGGAGCLTTNSQDRLSERAPQAEPLSACFSLPLFGQRQSLR